MIKFLRRLVFGFLGLVVVLFLARNFIARKSVELGVKRVTGFPLEVGAVKFGMFNGQLEARDLQLLNPPEFRERKFVDSPLLTVDYRTLSMLRGAPHIKELTLNVREVVIVKNEKGQTNAGLIQSRASSANSPGSGKKTAGQRKTPYRLDLLRVHIGTVIIKDFSKAQPTERRITLNRDMTFENITESSSVSALVMRSVLGPVGDAAGDLVKGVGGTVKGTGQNLQKTGRSLLESLKKVVPAK